MKMWIRFSVLLPVALIIVANTAAAPQKRGVEPCCGDGPVIVQNYNVFGKGKRPAQQQQEQPPESNPTTPRWDDWTTPFNHWPVDWTTDGGYGWTDSYGNYYPGNYYGGLPPQGR